MGKKIDIQDKLYSMKTMHLIGVFCDIIDVADASFGQVMTISSTLCSLAISAEDIEEHAEKIAEKVKQDIIKLSSEIKKRKEKEKNHDNKRTKRTRKADSDRTAQADA